MLPKLRKFAFKLVLWLAVSDMMFAVANLMGDPKHGSALCYVQVRPAACTRTLDDTMPCFV